VSDIYSQLKPAWHPDRLADLKMGIRPKPIHVQLILSDLCNHDCGFCAYRMSEGLSNELFADEAGRANPHRMIPAKKAIEIVDDCAEMGVAAVQFTGGGEPTVHPQHRDIFVHAQNLGIETALVTNGIKMQPDHEAFGRMTWIRVSVDAGDPLTYSKVRRVPVGHWIKVWANIAALAETYTGTLGVGFVVTPENYKGIAVAAQMAKDAGAKNMRVGAVFSTAGTSFYGDLIPEICGVIDNAKSRIEGNGFELVDLFGRRLGDLEHGRPTDPDCHYQYLTVYIGGDLSVYRCCNTAYTEAGKVGSLKDQRFKDAMLAYEPFDARGCRFCQFLGQNHAIKALLHEPTHVNFV
jgi:MoaA/NifB/PqqE/SkfB family radical SAM enzyme